MFWVWVWVSKIQQKRKIQKTNKTFEHPQITKYKYRYSHSLFRIGSARPFGLLQQIRIHVRIRGKQIPLYIPKRAFGQPAGSAIPRSRDPDQHGAVARWIVGDFFQFVPAQSGGVVGSAVVDAGTFAFVSRASGGVDVLVGFSERFGHGLAGVRVGLVVGSWRAGLFAAEVIYAG